MKEIHRQFRLSTLTFAFSMRFSARWERFGGGWRWKVGIEASPLRLSHFTIGLNLLVARIEVRHATGAYLAGRSADMKRFAQTWEDFCRRQREVPLPPSKPEPSACSVCGSLRSFHGRCVDCTEPAHHHEPKED